MAASDSLSQLEKREKLPSHRPHTAAGMGRDSFAEASWRQMEGPIAEAAKSINQLWGSLSERAAPFVFQTAISSLAYSGGLAATQVHKNSRGER